LSPPRSLGRKVGIQRSQLAREKAIARHYLAYQRRSGSLAARAQRCVLCSDHVSAGLYEGNAARVIVAINQTLLTWLGYRVHEVYGVMIPDALLIPVDNNSEVIFRHNAGGME
jgi:hypothetical protein